jgi:YebC/PmpR family DNA-binding regulatory protein
MPKDNITKAIQRGTGELKGVEYTECLFEGYGPKGVAILIEGMTDNINRTSADIRSILSKNNGSLGAQGCVAWIFENKGLILLEKKAASEDKLMEIAIKSGADDLLDRGDHWEVPTDPENFEAVRNAFEKEKISMLSSEITKVPQNTVSLELEDAQRLFNLIEKLEDNDDVQKVHGNYEVSDEIMEKIA